MRYIILILLVFSTSSLFSQIELDDGEKAILLNRHNFFRQIVGSNEFYWADDLAEVAQQEAISIAQNPYSAAPNTAYGINIYRSSTKPDFVYAVNYWAKEQRYYHGEVLTDENILQFGHYTQIVWQNTVALGCAMAQTQGGTYILVCAYSPKGNQVGQKPF
ncbi:MAG: hypothetical protein JXR68_05635 [Bacteroidales bacterium]|nr:hypothetical protein [Bacteroidales bacterium]